MLVLMAHGKLGSGGIFPKESFEKFSHVRSFLSHFQTIEAVSMSNYSCMRN